LLLGAVHPDRQLEVSYRTLFRNERNTMTRLACLLSLAFCLVIFPRAQGAQEADDTRGILPVEFVKARPDKAHASVKAGRRTLYRRPGGTPVAASGGFAQLGLTIWRLRPATAADTGARLIVQKESETIELIPERLPANAPLHIGERIRFSFESPQAGYLYVIDREQFADGSMGEPVLIFPTTRTRNGANQVPPRKPIQ